jgi:hypothetical protein
MSSVTMQNRTISAEWITPGWFGMITCALKCFAFFGGSFVLSQVTIPRFISFTEIFLVLKLTLFPGRVSVMDSWRISTKFTSAVMLAGYN